MIAFSLLAALALVASALGLWLFAVTRDHSRTSHHAHLIPATPRSYRARR